MPTRGERARLALPLAGRYGVLLASAGLEKVRRARPNGAARPPAALDDLSPAWLTEALSAAHPGAVVRDFKVVTRTDGTTTRARLAVEYEDGGEGAPAVVFVKVSPRLGHRLLMVGLGQVEGEVRFYRELAAQVPVNTPPMHHVAYHRPSASFAFVMGDLASEDVRFGSAVVPLSRDEAASVVRALARLHGSFWGAERLDPYGWLQSPTDGPFFRFNRVFRMPLSRALAAAGELVPEALQVPRKLAAGFWRLQALNARPPHSLLHGDAHVGNMWFGPGGEPGLLDWQLVQRGSWGHDVGYFLAGALAVPDRRRWERDLLSEYLDELAAGGGEALDADHAWLHYRRQAAYGLCMWLATLALGDYQHRDIARACVERFAAAAADHESFELLAVA